MSSDPIVIVGAGIGGLTAGLALPQQGIDVAVCEQAEALGEIGAVVQIIAKESKQSAALTSQC